MKKIFICFLTFLLIAGNSFANDKKGVEFGNLKDGQEVQSPFKVEMKVYGMKVQPAGEFKEGTGHHHIIINNVPTAEGNVVPADEKHIHYGLGQTETELNLPPGEHFLTLQFADGFHRSYGKEWSKTVRIKVIK